MKLKIIQLLALLFISTPLFSQDEIESKWKNSGNAVFLVNQSSFSNWTSGGQSSISELLKLITILIMLIMVGIGIPN